MSVQAYKIKALMKKDVKDIRRNSSAVLMATLSMFFTLLYRFLNLGGEQLPAEFVLSTGVLMNISMLPLSVIAMLIAEEKEKNTLRTLMLNNVSAGEFLISKAAIVLLIAEVVNTLCYLFAQATIPFVTFLSVTVLACVCMLFFGATIGIISKNQMSTGVITAPMTMLMLLPAILGMVDEGIASVARFTPTFSMLQLLFGQGSAVFSLLMIIGWTAAAGVLFSVIYARKRLDS